MSRIFLYDLIVSSWQVSNKMGKKVSLFVLTLVACVILLNTFVFAGSSAPSYKITSMKAYLFYEQWNSFSEDILADPDIALWNTIIGEVLLEASHIPLTCGE